jgi:hypothetical protein
LEALYGKRHLFDDLLEELQGIAGGSPWENRQNPISGAIVDGGELIATRRYL